MDLLRFAALATLASVVCPLFAARQGPARAPWKTMPGDRDKTHQLRVTASALTYEIEMDAAVDGVMTRMPVGYGAYQQGWQPNRFVRLENVGNTDVVNPWLIVNRKRGWRTLKEIAQGATRGWKSDRDKARAIWEFTRHHRFHACTWDHECDDAVKVFNVYGYTLCGNDAQVVSDLWKAAGLTIRRGYPTGHCVAEVLYDGEFHLLDGDEHCIFLRRDNETIASEAEVVRDHDLVKRTHTYGILRADSRKTDEFSASLYIHEGERKGEWGGRSKHTMAYVLRPGESIEWRWDHVGKQYTAGTETPDGKWHKNGQGDLAVWGRNAYGNMRNGRMRYAPDLSNPVSRRGLTQAANLADAGPGLYPQAPGKPSHATWQIASAYVIVGGRVTATCRRACAQDVLKVSLSRDGKKWETLWRADRTGSFERQIVFDDKLSPRKRPQYMYFLRVDMTAKTTPTDVAVEKIAFDTDVQMAALALPELEAGPNGVEYVDETPGPRQVRITHSWVERPAWRPPGAPKLVSPANGATVEGTQTSFTWQAPKDPDGDRIADYRIQVCKRADMRWVLSPNFDKLVSHTPSRGKSEWLVPYVGLLNPGTTYHWRVRAKDDKGVWGPWSEAWSFQCDAPGAPLRVRAEADAAQGTVLLTWHANPKGAEPVHYRVYASDEKGFSVSDAAYNVLMGRGFCRDLKEFEAKGNVKEMVKTPANLVTTTRERRLIVVGPDLKLPNANKAYYRVVAVDARGLTSGPSDYAEAPRPFIYTKPPSRATVGKKFVYEPKSLLSIGDLRCKRGYKRAFWDREQLTWSLAKAPKWLSIDAATGRIAGTAQRPGRREVVVRVRNDKGKSGEQGFEVEVPREQDYGGNGPPHEPMAKKQGVLE